MGVANEAIFQMMMISYKPLLLLKFDFLGSSEFQLQIKTFCMKYVLLAGKIIRIARYVVMKPPAKYPFIKMNGIIIGLNSLNLFFLLTNRVKEHENIETPLLESDKLSVFQ
jgi:hypothetical protein